MGRGVEGNNTLRRVDPFDFNHPIEKAKFPGPLLPVFLELLCRRNYPDKVPRDRVTFECLQKFPDAAVGLVEVDGRSNLLLMHTLGRIPVTFSCIAGFAEWLEVVDIVIASPALRNLVIND